MSVWVWLELVSSQLCSKQECAVSKKWLQFRFWFGFAKNCSFQFNFSFTKLTAVSFLSGSVFYITFVCQQSAPSFTYDCSMMLEMTYFHAELVQLIVSLRDSELDVPRYGMMKNTLTVSYHVGSCIVNEIMW